MRSAPTTSAGVATDPATPGVPAPYPETALSGTGGSSHTGVPFFYPETALSGTGGSSHAGVLETGGSRHAGVPV